MSQANKFRNEAGRVSERRFMGWKISSRSKNETQFESLQFSAAKQNEVLFRR